jgi:peroxiredoxin/mono/diheme cytochrome c family protein
MSANAENFSGPTTENLVVRRRGREVAKLVGAVVFALVGLALLGRSAWDFRDEWPSRQLPIVLPPRVGVVTSDELPLGPGQRVYQARCVRCHGQEGHGDGPEMAKSQVRPRDLASASWHSGADRDAVRRVILEGTADKSMPGSAGAIPAHELESLVDYVFSLETSNLLIGAGLSPSLGQIAPPLLFRDADGTVGALDQLRGKVVLAVFWDATCVPCITELPGLGSLADRYQNTDFVVLPICLDETNDTRVHETAARHAPNLRVYVDSNGSVRKNLYLAKVPQAVLVDRDGRMLGRSVSALRWTGKPFEQLLSAGLGLQSPLASEEDAEF